MPSKPFFSEFSLTSYILWFQLKISILKVEKLIVLNKMMMNCTVALSTAAGCDILFFSHYLSHFLSTFFIIILIVFNLPDTPNPQKIFSFYLFIIHSMFTYCLFIYFFIFFIDLVGEMIENPFETKSDSFYFVNGSLIMHNKASYKVGK